jgi:hypothetical protein
MSEAMAKLAGELRPVLGEEDAERETHKQSNPEPPPTQIGQLKVSVVL